MSIPLNYPMLIAAVLLVFGMVAAGYIALYKMHLVQVRADDEASKIWKNEKWYTFSETSIANNAPAKSGVYAIGDKTKWIYIGEAKNIQHRLEEHCRRTSDKSECIWSGEPTSFSFELVWNKKAREQREAKMIRKYSPEGNR